jgi:adenylate kinase family enzyme
MLPLNSLGQRIAILGPSNAGKSTLAVAMAEKLDLPAVHLDQLRFLPQTNWTLRPKSEFEALHNTAILQDSWIIEGNYSSVMSPRLDRATGVVLISSNRWLRFGRYLQRTLQNDAKRAGHLEGGSDKLTWEMIDWVLIKSPMNTAKYASKINQAGKPSVQCGTAKELNSLYSAWELRLPI